MADKERRDRIVAHMNSQHVRQMIHFLRYYNDLPPNAATQPQLLDVSHQSMSIRSADGAKHNVKFSPPLQEWAEIRPRLLEMDETAREKLGLSDVYVTDFLPPSGFFTLLLCFLVLLTCSLTAMLPWVTPGSAAWGTLVRWGGGEMAPIVARRVVLGAFLFALTVHVVEAVLFEKKRMQRHGVERWSGLWWKWMGCVMLEGATAWQRVDVVIERTRAKKEAKSH